MNLEDFLGTNLYSFGSSIFNSSTSFIDLSTDVTSVTLVTSMVSTLGSILELDSISFCFAREILSKLSFSFIHSSGVSSISDESSDSSSIFSAFASALLFGLSAFASSTRGCPVFCSTGSSSSEDESVKVIFCTYSLVSSLPWNCISGSFTGVFFVITYLGFFL